jgi:hypothetical protein
MSGDSSLAFGPGVLYRDEESTSCMKKWAATIATNLILICVWAEFIRQFIANDSIHYFSDQPRRLLLVVALTAVGGVAIWAFSRLSPATRRGLMRLWNYSIALLIACLVAWAGAFIYLCRSAGASVSWHLYWMSLFMAWSPGSRTMADYVWRDGSKLMNHALLFSVLGFIPLAVLAAVLLHRLGRPRPDAV